MKKALVLLSGGLDSTTALYVAQEQGFDELYAITFEYGQKHDKEIKAAKAVAKAAGCDAFIRSLEHGYDTVVGGGGAHLSGGERQRIAIARAMLKDAPIVVLDEATAYIDPENEAVVQQAVGRLVAGKTVLVIAHRMRTVMHADQIVLLSGGRVTEIGRPADLLEKNGLFRHMAQLQSESMEWMA